MTVEVFGMETRRRPKADGALWVVVVATDSEWSGNVELVPAPYRIIADSRDTSLQRVLRRAGELVSREHICVVVAAEHRSWWAHPLWFLPASNVTSLSQHDSTEQGVTTAIKRILERDTAAKVVLLPTADSARTSGDLMMGPARALLEQVSKRGAPLARYRPAGLGHSGLDQFC